MSSRTSRAVQGRVVSAGMAIVYSGSRTMTLAADELHLLVGHRQVEELVGGHDGAGSRACHVIEVGSVVPSPTNTRDVILASVCALGGRHASFDASLVSSREYSPMSGRPVRRWLETVGQDLRYGLRSLRRTVLASSVMIASVALGIGVATAVFTLADVMLFRPLPYPNAGRLVVPYQTVIARARARRDTIPWSVARYEVLRRSIQGFEDAGFAAWVDGIIRPDVEDKPVRIEAVTPSLLTTLSIGAQRGRVFRGDEDATDAPATVAMISDRLWRSEYGADPSVIGRTVVINGVPVSVIGIMPAGFNGFAVGADVWLPLRMMARVDPSPRWTERLAMQAGTVIARAAPGLTMLSLQRQLAAAAAILNTVVADRFIAPDAERGIGVMTLADARRHPLVKPMLQLMGAAVLGLMLTVCANIASILLARGHARRNEMGVRIAMGASGGRIGRQVLTESTLLGALGLPVGMLLGLGGAMGLASVRPALPQSWILLRGTDLLAGASLAPNLRVLAFSSALAALATLLFGTGPAVAASRVDPVKLMTSAGDSHTAAPVRGRQVLVMAQVALATILLVAAGLMTRSLRAMLATDLGFRPRGVVTFRLTSSDTSASARIRRQEILTQVSGLAGVRGVATSACVPFDVACMVTVGLRAVGDADPTARPVDVELHSTSSDYFRTIGIVISSGRALVAEDTTVGRPRVVISETAARRLFGAASPIGKEVAFTGGDGAPMEVVGVARDVRFRSVDAAASPAVYVVAGENPYAPRYTATLLVRTNAAPGVAISSVTRAIRESGAPVGVSEARPLTSIVSAETSSTRFIAVLLLGFAVSAALLAGLGVYGVIAFIIAQRSREFGVRLVLGADQRHLLRTVVGRGAALVGGGVVIGVVVALGASRLVAALLYGVESFDAATYGVVAALVLVIGLMATFVPAYRIGRIDPSAALRG